MNLIQRHPYLLAAVLAAFLLTVAAPLVAADPNCSAACVKRVEAREFAERHGGCHDRECVRRVTAKARAREMARYKAAPMPACTWVRESGPVSAANPEWSGPRYTIWNGSQQWPVHGRGSASGKYQFIRSTWIAIGGKRLGYDVAAEAPPVIQERLARVLLRDGLHHWARC